MCEAIFNHDNIVITTDHTGTEYFQDMNLGTALSVAYHKDAVFSAGFDLNAGYLIAVCLSVCVYP